MKLNKDEKEIIGFAAVLWIGGMAVYLAGLLAVVGACAWVVKKVFGL